jgi:hypothetical protein
MGLDLWFREDVARILASTQETMSNSLGAVSPLDPEIASAYRVGFGDALRAVSVAFGVRTSDVTVWDEQGHLTETVRLVNARVAGSGPNGTGQRS